MLLMDGRREDASDAKGGLPDDSATTSCAAKACGSTVKWRVEMTTRIERPAVSLAACVEIAERLTPELGNSLRWLATYPDSGAMLIIEGFVRDAELMLVADMPRGSIHRKIRPDDTIQRGRNLIRAHSTSRSGVQRSLLSFSVSLVPDGPESGEIGAVSASLPLSSANVRES
jgi:hypothetical protein